MKILAFGIIRDIVEGDSFDVALEGEQNVAALRTQLYASYPEMKKLKSLMVAVNSEYATDDLELSGKDEIALIPPVSGG